VSYRKNSFRFLKRITGENGGFFRRRRVTQIKNKRKKAAEGQKPCDLKEKRRFDSGQEPEDILPVKSAFSQV